MLELYPENAESICVCDNLQLLENANKRSLFSTTYSRNAHTSAEIWNHYAFVLFEEQEYTKAQKALQEALHQEPQNAFSWWILSLCCEPFPEISSQTSISLCTMVGSRNVSKAQLALTEQTENLLQQSINLLPHAQQHYWNSVIWNITDIPDPTSLTIPKDVSTKTITVLQSSTATLHIYRYNIAHLKLNKEAVQQIIYEELSTKSSSTMAHFRCLMTLFL